MLSSPVRHDLSFWHGRDRLGGRLRMPGAPGPHPVLLMVQEPSRTRHDYSAWLDVLADAGFASFSWDRAPVPETGPQPRRPVAHQAREVLAAVDRLRFVPELDPDAVAVMGWGEGGWAAAQATTFSDRPAALILAGVPTVPAAGQAGAVHDRWAGHDPRPTLSAVTVPVLALFGEHDPLVPHRSAVRGLREALGGSGHVDHEVAVVRGADHGLRVLAPHGLGGMVHGFHRFGDWPPALSRLVVEWLERRLLPDEVPTYAPPQHAPALRLPTPARSRSGSALPPSVPVRQLRRRVPR